MDRDSIKEVQVNDVTLQSKFSDIFKGSSALLAFSVIFFLISLGDAIMSYSTPVYLESVMQSSTMMGIVLATSSVVGFFADLVFGEWFRGKSYKFFMFWTFVTAVCFPLSFLVLPPFIVFLILSMAIWGIYYELIQFSNYHFINKYTSRDKHTFAWSLLSIFKSLGYAIGPIVAGLLINDNMNQAFLAALGFYVFGIFGFLLFLRTHKKRHEHPEQEDYEQKKNILHEVKIWLTLGKRIWPLLLFVFTVVLVDSTFWSVGAVLSEVIKEKGAPGEFLLTIYMIPSLFVGLLSTIVANKFGKKRGAFWTAGILSALMLLPMGFFPNPWMLFVFTFLSATFGAIGTPLISAAYADYIERLGEKGNDLIGLQSSASSISYIVGPIVAGILADQIGFEMTFTVMGVLLLIISVLCIFLTPRKIRLPQSELSAL